MIIDYLRKNNIQTIFIPIYSCEGAEKLTE